jgi:peptide/nickel transport system permease protein
MICAAIVVGVGGGRLAPHDPNEIDLISSYAPPSFLEGGTTNHLLGTDATGRDILSRLIVAVRMSLVLCLAALLLSAVLGGAFGVAAGYVGGWFESLCMRIVDIMLSLPTLLLALLLALTLGPSGWTVVGVLVLTLWARFARVIRGSTREIRGREFVQYARVAGRSHFWIVRRHIVPHILNTLVAFATLQLGITMLLEASLSYLGASIPPPTATLGRMVQDGQGALELAWWVSIIPATAILILVLAFNRLGDWLRDVLDPTLRQGA